MGAATLAEAERKLLDAPHDFDVAQYDALLTLKAPGALDAWRRQEPDRAARAEQLLEQHDRYLRTSDLARVRKWAAVAEALPAPAPHRHAPAPAAPRAPHPHQNRLEAILAGPRRFVASTPLDFSDDVTDYAGFDDLFPPRPGR